MRWLKLFLVAAFCLFLYPKTVVRAAFPIHKNLPVLSQSREGMHLRTVRATRSAGPDEAKPCSGQNIERHCHKWLAALLSFPLGLFGLGRLYMGYYILGGIELFFWVLAVSTIGPLVAIGFFGIIFNFFMGVMDMARVLELPNRHGRTRALNPKNGDWTRGA